MMDKKARIEQCKKNIEVLETELKKLQERRLDWIDNIEMGSLIKLHCGFTFLVGRCGGKHVLTSVYPNEGRFNGTVGGPWDSLYLLKRRLKEYSKDHEIKLVNKEICLVPTC
jgi:hypothetical protein